jgi:ubiquinone biosynthesis protein UbiJ
VEEAAKAEEATDELSVYSNDHALAQARKEMDRLRADIARLKAQLQES